MATIIEALHSLGIDSWALMGQPKNETEFNSMFKKVVGKDYDGSAILSSDVNDFGVTWQQIIDKQQELQTAYENNAYQRKRKAEYPPIAEQLDDLYHNGIEGWKSTIKAIKDKYPKE